MNKIAATITAVTRNDSLCFVETRAGDIPFALLLFDMKPELCEGSAVWLLFKESEVDVANRLGGAPVSVMCSMRG
ncbi:hypothetical protein [Geobacter sp. FeAm09]|uniref:hypothetical protein n=1 Tax=Geobacter sp. FeAm09 TaxID=2597769 RepID=UPI00143DA220|nr:hypothetical protein [Geobacter sp. FeAm09]